MTITTDESTFLGFCFELILYGFYVKLFAEAIIVLTRRRKTQNARKFYLFFCCLLFSCCTIHLFINFNYMYKDLVRSRNPTGAIQTGTVALRTADALVTLTDFFGEIVLIFRVWTIWEHDIRVIVLPDAILKACAMSTIGILVSTPQAAIVPKSLVPLGTAAFALPLCFNAVVCTLIIWRILSKGRQNQRSLRQAGAAIMPRNYARDAAGVVIESASLYLVVQLVFTALFAINHPAQILLSAVATQIYGIAPTLIFTRAASLAHPEHFNFRNNETSIDHGLTIHIKKQVSNETASAINADFYEMQGLPQAA
ncbi:hypothetical protein BT96DRAFT_1006032 [Gymnopus androsaceus JB14]|uniref:Uncharacterized protein n=1 Tax=Gymnopus androsaceus JB14 TaxID=1447944 RepID=A0A6A4GMF1_9AGAR|nr:hypothetical protein BT96DRAFT_1006032 [Gymnopus androsaceus JB14]